MMYVILFNLDGAGARCSGIVNMSISRLYAACSLLLPVPVPFLQGFSSSLL